MTADIPESMVTAFAQATGRVPITPATSTTPPVDEDAVTRRLAAMTNTARTLAVELDRREDQRREIDAALSELLVTLAVEHPGFDWTTDRFADALDVLTKLVLPTPGAGTCHEVAGGPGLTIGTGRPYPPTGLTTAAWSELEPVLVDLDHVTTTQDAADLRSLVHGLRRGESDVYPHVVEWQGRRYLEDGHNLAVRRYLRGVTIQRCRVFRRPVSA